MATKTNTTYNQAGQQIGQTQVPIPDDQANNEQVWESAQTDASAAIASLRAYIALASPTQAQTAAQVKVQARILLRMMRLALQRWDDVD